MLVLTRKLQEQIRIGDNITLTILRVKGNTVRVGIEAPRNVRVIRGELPRKEDSPRIADGQETGEPAARAGHPAGREAEMELGETMPGSRRMMQLVLQVTGGATAAL